MAMTDSGATTPFALRGQGIGIIVATCFGALWAVWARAWLSHYPAIVPWAAYATTAAISSALLAAGIATVRRARRQTGEADTRPAIRRRIGRQYWLVVTTEVVVLNLAAAALFRFDLGQYLPPAIAIIVGLHFFPLAHTFRAPHLHATATLMTLAGATATLAMAAGGPGVVVAGLADMACAGVLWGTALVSWLRVRKAMANPHASFAATVPAD